VSLSASSKSSQESKDSNEHIIIEGQVIVRKVALDVLYESVIKPASELQDILDKKSVNKTLKIGRYKPHVGDDLSSVYGMAFSERQVELMQDNKRAREEKKNESAAASLARETEAATRKVQQAITANPIIQRFMEGELPITEEKLNSREFLLENLKAIVVTLGGKQSDCKNKKVSAQLACQLLTTKMELQATAEGKCDLTPDQLKAAIKTMKDRITTIQSSGTRGSSAVCDTREKLMIKCAGFWYNRGIYT